MLDMLDILTPIMERERLRLTPNILPMDIILDIAILDMDMLVIPTPPTMVKAILSKPISTLSPLRFPTLVVPYILQLVLLPFSLF